MQKLLSKLLLFSIITLQIALVGCSSNSTQATKPETAKQQSLAPANPADASLASNLSGNSLNQSGDQPKIGLSIGNQAPDFTVTMVDGKVLKLFALKGQPVFLNFWATWCPPCKQEMPDIEKIWQEKRPVQIIALNLKESSMVVGSFLNANGYHFPVGYDTKGEIASLYRVTGIPTSYAIDRNGIIRNKIVGPLSYNQLSRWFTEMEAIQ